MTKREFLEKLRLALNGRLSPELLTENMQYYEDYINTEIRKGRTEEEVMELLGDPRLIARTIIETKGGGGNAVEEAERPDRGRFRQGLSLRMPGWMWLIVILLILALVLSVVFSVLSIVLPVLIPIALVLLLVKAFRDWFS